jgi:hypothetical protein
MPTSTYTALATITLTGTDSEVVFASIPQSYRDLIVVCKWGLTGSGDSIGGFRLNGATSGYTTISMVSQAGSPSAETRTGDNVNFVWRVGNDNSTNSTTIIQIMDYSATDKHKISLTRNNGPANDFINATAGRLASTAAVTSVALRPWNGGNIASGSTFSLYGIVS